MKLLSIAIVLTFSALSGHAQMQEQMQGAIDSTYFFHATITTHGTTLSGRYRYDNHDEWIELEGPIIHSTREFTLYEYVTVNGKRTQHSVFKGKKSGSDMMGTWMMLDGKNKKLPFYFTGTSNIEGRTTLCSSKTFFSNKRLPVKRNKVYTLINDDDGGVGALIWFDQVYRDKFTIEFDYYTWDDDGQSALFSTNSADGLSLILFQDKSAYQNTTIPGGGEMGFIKNGIGLAVQFVLYANRRVQILNGNGESLGEMPAQTLSKFTDAPTRPWSTVAVTVDGDQLTVVLDGRALTATIPVSDQDASGFGIGAGTGGADGLHRVKNVRITR